MKASSRRFVAVALSLGAAAFSFPAQALKCLPPPYSPLVASPDSMPKRATEYASSRVAELQSIFRGHPVAAAYSGIRGPEGNLVYIVTYQVSEWFKGRGRTYAKVAYRTGWCDDCKMEESIANFTRDKADAYIFADKAHTDDRYPAELRDDLDGANRLCGNIGPYSSLAAMKPKPDARDDGEFLFKKALKVELDTLRRNKRPLQH